MSKYIFIAILLTSASSLAADLKPIVLDPSYNHTKWGIEGGVIIREFRAYTSSFDDADDADDDDGFGGADTLRVPE